MDVTSTLLMFLLFGVLVFLALFSFSYALLKGGSKIPDRVSISGNKVGKKWWDSARSNRKLKEVLEPIGRMVPRPPAELSRESEKLVQAGFRQKNSVFLFYGVRVLVAITLLVTTLIFQFPTRNPVVLILGALLMGALLPDIWLRWRIRRRQDRIQWGLPDMMDLSVVCVEAGLGLDQTLQRISYEIRIPYPELSEELRIYSLEVNAGKGRTDAFRNLARRTGVKDLLSLAGILIQADRFGTSIAHSLRVFSESLRVKRRQQLEEEAAKMAVKMLFPLLIFIFPSIFVVVVGPAMITISQDFFRFLGGQ